MAMFRVELGVGHVDGGDLTTVTALVDASADHSMLPESLLSQLRITPRRQLEFVLSDGGRVEYGYGFARLRIDSEEWPCPVLFGPEGSYLLGASALEIFNLEEDRGSERLLQAKWPSLGCAGRDDSAIGGATPIHPTAVAPLEGYRIWLRYSDGVAGEVDLSDLAGRGVFSAWDDRTSFEAVRLDSYGAITWGADIDLCPDALYMRLTDKSAAEAMSEPQVPIENA
jgi:predicted aspartyl protease